MAPNFAPAYSFARQFGVKALVYGPPGKGKTPICDTAPRPVLCASEPGLLSMRNSQIMTCTAFTPKEIEEFYLWLEKSPEANNYDTVCVDSISQQAEIILKDELTKHKDGRAAYGAMSIKMMKYIDLMYFGMKRNIYLIAKQALEDGTNKRIPYFPGKDLGIKVPHLFDEILHLDTVNVPGVVGAVNAFRCRGAYDVSARDRSGNLAEFEQPNLTNLFNKIIGN